MTIYFSTNSIVASVTSTIALKFKTVALVSKRSTLLSCKFVNGDINIPSLVPDEDKKFGGSLVLDFRNLCHVKTIYCQ